MRMIVAGCLSVVLGFPLAACEPEMPKRAASDKVVEGVADRGATWPLLLQHCLRTPHCDPTSDFGRGEEQASSLVGSTAWFAETQERVKEGPEDYGSAITLSVFATRGQGGPAGRPLTINELPDTLHATAAKRSRLAIEYRAPGGGAPEPYGLWFDSPWLVVRSEPMDEAKVEISGKDGVLLSDLAGGSSAEEEGKKTTPETIEPVAFYFPRNIRDDRVDALLQALMAGETLSLKLYAPDGGLLLNDAFYTVGYDSALKEATAALADPEIKRTIEERCARFATQKDEFWKIADVTAALRVCDPRTAEQRQRDASAPAFSAPDR